MFAETKILQELLAEDAKREGLKPIERSALARVWKELGEFRLRLQGKGPPKSVDYTDRRKRGKAKGTKFDYGEAPVVASDTTSPSVPSDKPSPEDHKSEQTPKTE